jgi:nuclear pore complex protein Nup107
LESTDDLKWPGYRVQRDFKIPDPSLGETRLIRNVECFLYAQTGWGEAFYPVSFALKMFLLSGQIGGALEMTKKVPYKAMSLSKSEHYLHRKVDVFNLKDSTEAVDEEGRQLRRSNRRQQSEPLQPPQNEEGQFMLEMLREQSRQYREMQQLCMAIEQVQIWHELEQYVEKSYTVYVVPHPHPSRSLLTFHQSAKDEERGSPGSSQRTHRERTAAPQGFHDLLRPHSR